MRRVLFILTLLLATTSLTAQNFTRRGFSLGADRDTVLYIIASPFDNWYITLNGGIQTFIGNELEASARRNKLNYNTRVEIGKWIIPDVAVSLRLSHYTVDGQTRYGRHPFVDFTDVPVHDGYFEYQPFHANAFALVGFVTFDWTNFFRGYEHGKRKHWHIYSPIGLGASILYGKQINPNTNIEVGSYRQNLEYFFDAGMGLEYIISENISVFATAEVFASESTWDWSPYDNSYSIFDIIPSLSGGIRLNLLKNVNKFDPRSRTTNREKVNHEFIAFGTRHTVTTLTGRIENLNARIDSVQNLSDQRGHQDSTAIAAMTEELTTLQAILDSAENGLGKYRPSNVMDELINFIPIHNIPASIVYFQLDKYNIDFNGHRRLQNFAKELSRMDDTVEFFVIGAADSATGSVKHNQWLSERRSEAVYKALVNHYNVDGNQLIMVPVGGIAEYEMNENNRMTLVILRTPETEEIIRRWTQK